MATLLQQQSALPEGIGKSAAANNQSTNVDQLPPGSQFSVHSWQAMITKLQLHAMQCQPYHGCKPNDVVDQLWRAAHAKVKWRQEKSTHVLQGVQQGLQSAQQEIIMSSSNRDTQLPETLRQENKECAMRECLYFLSPERKVFSVIACASGQPCLCRSVIACASSAIGQLCP